MGNTRTPKRKASTKADGGRSKKPKRAPPNAENAGHTACVCCGNTIRRSSRITAARAKGNGGSTQNKEENKAEQESLDSQQLSEDAPENISQQQKVVYHECATCGELYSAGNLPAMPECTHTSETCAECYAGWIESQLKSKSWNEIKCPGEGCRVMVNHQLAQHYASREVFEEFDRLSARSALGDIPNFRWCRGPGCESGQIHETSEDGYIFRCAACELRWCVSHEDTWHEGETCEQFDSRLLREVAEEEDMENRRVQKEAEEKATEAMIGQIAKKCPACERPIEKNLGCDHMTCSICHHEFCWLCFASYVEIRRVGNSAHGRGCRYYG